MDMDRRGFLEDKTGPVSEANGRNEIILALIPYEETTTYGKGTANAPEAVVDASAHIELFDEVLHLDASRRGILTLRPDITDLASITASAREIRESHPDSLLGFVGGEHSVTPAIIEGIAREEMGIVWIDAHGDLRQSFHGRRDNHGCAGFNSMGFGPIVQIGIRAIAEEEWDLLGTTDRVKQFREWGDDAAAAIDALPDNIYITMDADGFSPEVVRAVGTPEPGGLYWDEVMDCLDHVFGTKHVFAFDTVELCPQENDLASSFTIARLVYKAMAYHVHHRLTSR